MNEVQKLELELVRHASFNNCDGPQVVADLEAHTDLWRGAVMTRVGFGELICLRDIENGHWNVDTLFISAASGKEDELEKLALRSWSADEVSWVEDGGDMLGVWPAPKVLRVWWD